MIAVLNHARVVKPVVLVSNSLSAASSNIVAVKHPDRVQGIVILNGFVRDMPAGMSSILIGMICTVSLFLIVFAISLSSIRR